MNAVERAVRHDRDGVARFEPWRQVRDDLVRRRNVVGLSTACVDRRDELVRSQSLLDQIAFGLEQLGHDRDIGRVERFLVLALEHALP